MVHQRACPNFTGSGGFVGQPRAVVLHYRTECTRQRASCLIPQLEYNESRFVISHRTFSTRSNRSFCVFNRPDQPEQGAWKAISCS